MTMRGRGGGKQGDEPRKMNLGKLNCVTNPNDWVKDTGPLMKGVNVDDNLYDIWLLAKKIIRRRNFDGIRKKPAIEYKGVFITRNILFFDIY